ncbi:MAG TPA: hypothetical protein VEQ85_03315, partial [Lacipirellulaceae bacterium]|nr:hypothetical protein [Lacipirellulaceae bacterium]
SPEELAERGWQVAAIERSLAGGQRFELEGVERGAWLEWHPAGEGPTSFVGGLGTPRGLTRTKALGNGWFISRYDSPHRD